jgi:aryl-alcohol dehydrogenase-like predicted oxidoreductase
MDYVRLGASGLSVSRVALGMMSFGDPGQRPWALSQDAAELIVRRAVDAGVIFFDTADVYGAGSSEEITGRLLPKFFAGR